MSWWKMCVADTPQELKVDIAGDQNIPASVKATINEILDTIGDMPSWAGAIVLETNGHFGAAIHTGMNNCKIEIKLLHKAPSLADESPAKAMPEATATETASA
jgi:hypothetical protein